MAVSSSAVTVATTATVVSTGGSSGGEAVSIYNNGAATVYLGASGVTTADGYPLAAGEHIAVDLERGESVYGIVASGTVEVRVLEAGG